MKKTLQQYLDDEYGGSAYRMSKDWGIAQSTICQNLAASKPVHVRRDDSDRIVSALAALNTVLAGYVSPEISGDLKFVKHEIQAYLFGAGNHGRITLESELKVKS